MSEAVSIALSCLSASGKRLDSDFVSAVTFGWRLCGVGVSIGYGGGHDNSYRRIEGWHEEGVKGMAFCSASRANSDSIDQTAVKSRTLMEDR